MSFRPVCASVTGQARSSVGGVLRLQGPCWLQELSPPAGLLRGWAQCAGLQPRPSPALIASSYPSP